MYPDISSLRADLGAGRIDRRTAIRLAVAAGLSLQSVGALLQASPAVPSRVRATGSTEPLRKRVDYVLVGSGTAGCVLAHRLSADRSVNVVVLEGGAWPTDPTIDVPQAWPALQGGAFDGAKAKAAPHPVPWGARTERPAAGAGGAAGARGARAGRRCCSWRRV